MYGGNWNGSAANNNNVNSGGISIDGCEIIVAIDGGSNNEGDNNEKGLYQNSKGRFCPN